MKGLYPLATQDGKAIPLDVVRPASLVKFDFVAAGSSEVIVPTGYDICYVWATRDCILRLSNIALPGILVTGAEYKNAIFIPAQKAMTLMLAPGKAQLLGLASPGNLYISAVEQWAAMLQSKQASVG